MAHIEWDESFSVFDHDLDKQHKEWILIFNTMHSELSQGNTEELNNLATNALQKMQKYADYHFKFEEDKMRKNNFPDLIAHHRMHKDFNSLIYEYIRDIRQGTIVLNTRVLKMIKNWLVDHILIEDKKYAQFMTDPKKNFLKQPISK